MIYKLLFIILFSFSICLYLIKLSSKKKFSTDIQKHSIHKIFIPRLGGLAIYISLVTISFYEFYFNYSNKMAFLSLLLLPIFIAGIVEDIFSNVKPSIRLLASLMSALLFCYFYEPINSIDFPLLDFLMNFEGFKILLTLLAFMAITNSFNLLDGLNGLCTFNYLSVMLSILLIQYFDNLTIMDVNIYALFLPLGFLLLNFPLSKIFLGDSGAYILGFISAFSITVFFNHHHHDYFSWSAILLLIYPITETIFSFIRRFFSNNPIMNPDNSHLHNILFSYFQDKDVILANPIATIVLLPIIIYGPLLGFLFRNNFLFTITSIFTFIFIYIFLYIKFYKKKD